MDKRNLVSNLISSLLSASVAIVVFYWLAPELLVHPHTQLRFPYFHILWPAFLLFLGAPATLLLLAKWKLSDWQLWSAVILLGFVLLLLAIFCGHLWAGSVGEMLGIPSPDLFRIIGGLMLIAGFRLNAFPSFLIFVGISLLTDSWKRARRDREVRELRAH